MARTFPNCGPTPTKCWSGNDGIGDDDKDVTTGGMTRCLGDVEWAQAGYDTTWPATRVVLRGVEAGLGGHDAGVSGVDAGVEKSLIPISKWGRSTLSESPTFSDFVPAPKRNASEN